MGLEALMARHCNLDFWTREISNRLEFYSRALLVIALALAMPIHLRLQGDARHWPVLITVSSGGSRIFPRGCAKSQKAIIFQFFAENCLKMKEFGPLEGGVPGAPLGSANGIQFLVTASNSFSCRFQKKFAR